MEYFVASYIIKQCVSLDHNDDKELEQSLLNKFIFYDHPAILKFLSEYYYYQDKIVEKFFIFINRTKNNSNIDKLASNCATLLNYSSKVLLRINFDNIRIPYADFKNAILKNSTFIDCNLSYTRFIQANISNCEFQICDLSNATTGQIKIKDHTSSVSSVLFSNNNKYLVTGSHDKSIIIYEFDNNFNKI